jgi:uncharacterized protein HemY
MTNDTRFKQELMRLCEKRPELRKKLAVELARSRKPLRKRADSEANHMIVRALLKMSERAPEILDMIDAEADELEDWQQFKLHMAAEYIDAVYDSIRFRLQEEDL